MWVKQHVNTELVTLLYDFSEYLDICVIDLSFVRLDSFPGDMQPNNIESPASQIL